MGLVLPQLMGVGRRSSLLNSLVAHWKLDEASGSRFDHHGANDLTDNNTVTQAAGKLANAAQFTAANSEYLSIADNAALSVGNLDFTIGFWVYFDTVAADQTVISKATSDSSVVQEYKVTLNSASTRLEFRVADGAVNVYTVTSPNGSISATTWYHVLVYENAAADTIGISLNAGTADEVGSVIDASHDGAGTFRLGANGTPGVYMDGRIDSVSIWKRLLTAAERTRLYNSGNGLAYPF